MGGVMLSQRMTERITIEQPVRVRDPATGSTSTTWSVWSAGSTPMAHVPAHVLTGPGREPVQAGARYTEADLRVEMHYVEGINPTMRVVWRGQPYGVVAVDYDASARRVVRLTCRSMERDR